MRLESTSNDIASASGTSLRTCFDTDGLMLLEQAMCLTLAIVSSVFDVAGVSGVSGASFSRTCVRADAILG